MMSGLNSEDDILDINGDIIDILPDGEFIYSANNYHVETSHSDVQLENKLDSDSLQFKEKEFVWLKFFRKGKISCLELRDDLLKFLALEAKLIFNGIFFKDYSDVLVEVEVNDSLRSYLRKIYEERLGSKVLKKRAISDIVKLCDGKFSIIVKSQLMFLVILHKVNLVLLPCMSLSTPYGLSNGSLINVETEGFIVDKRFSIYETFLLIQDECNNNFNYFVGMILEKSEVDSEKSFVRFSIKHDCLNNEILVILKKIFCKIYFSRYTIHLLPETCVEANGVNALNFNSNLSGKDLMYPL
jgi:hypothetical protein